MPSKQLTWRQKNREKYNAYQREWHAKNKEKNREKYLTANKQWREKNRERHDAYQKQYREDNLEKIRAYDKERYANNRETVLARTKRYYAENKEKCIAKNKQYYEKHRERPRVIRAKHRLLVLKHYSKGKFECACCGENGYDFLEIDHINNDGNKHRREDGFTDLARWLINNNYPQGFQILCTNCNRSKGKHGICHHIRPVPRPKEEDFE